MSRRRPNSPKRLITSRADRRLRRTTRYPSLKDMTIQTWAGPEHFCRRVAVELRKHRQAIQRRRGWMPGR